MKSCTKRKNLTITLLFSYDATALPRFVNQVLFSVPCLKHFVVNLLLINMTPSHGSYLLNKIILNFENIQTYLNYQRWRHSIPKKYLDCQKTMPWDLMKLSLRKIKICPKWEKPLKYKILKPTSTWMWGSTVLEHCLT